MTQFPNELDGAGDGDGIDLRALLVHGVRRSFGWICLFVVVGAAAGIAIGLARPNEFVSNGKLLLRVGVRETITAESLVSVDNQPRDSRPTMADELAMLSDVSLFERVAREVGPREVLQTADPRRDDGPQTPWHTRLLHAAQASVVGSGEPDHDCAGAECESCVRAATKLLMENTTVANEPGSNVVKITCTSTSPEKAQAIIRALGRTFIERHREQFSTQALLDRNRGRLEQAKAERDEATDAYFRHIDECGFVDIETQAKSLLSEIDMLESELFSAKARRAEIERQRASLKERLTGVPANIEVTHPAVMVVNEEYETQLQLKRNLLQQKAGLSLENRPIEEYQRLQRKLDDQIAKADKLLQTIPREVPQSFERREKVGPSALAVRLDDLAVEDSALDVKVGLLQGRLAEKEERAKQLHHCEKDHAAMLSTRDAANTRYQRLVDRFAMLQALGSDDVQDDANLRILQYPTLEREKIGPKRLSLALKGLLAGLLVGLSFAMLRERFDERMIDPESFARRSRVPVLGMIPDQPGLKRSIARG